MQLQLKKSDFLFFINIEMIFRNTTPHFFMLVERHMYKYQTKLKAHGFDKFLAFGIFR